MSSFAVLGLAHHFVPSHQDQDGNKFIEKRNASVLALPPDNAEIAGDVHSAKGHAFSKIGILIPPSFWHVNLTFRIRIFEPLEMN